MGSQTVAVIGVPSSAGARRRGQERAPEVLRSAGLLERLASAGIECQDFGDLAMVRYEYDRDHPKCQNLGLVTAVARQVADRVEAALKECPKLLVIGGDCTLTLGVLAGLSRHVHDPGLMYFDGDIDMNTPEDTPSGVLDGMVLAHATGRHVNELSRIGSSECLVPDERIVVFGFNVDAGSIDPGELERFEESPMLRFPASHVREGASESAGLALGKLEERAEAFLLHFDVDALDHAEFPAADVGHPHGISVADAVTALRVFWSSPRCVGLVVTEFNPEDDPDGVYAERLADALIEAMR